MQIKELKNEEFLKEYEVVVSNDIIREKVESKITEAAKTFKMPGFREGKVPISIVKQKLEKEEVGKEINTQIAEIINHLSEKKKLKFFSRPDVQILSFTEDEGLKVKIAFELLPEVPEIKWSNITLDKIDVKVSDKEISEAKNIILKDFRSYEPAKDDHSIKFGDKVNLSYSGTIDGKEFDGNSAEKIDLVIGENTFSADFERKIIGCKKDEEKKLSAAFLPNYPKEDLAGKVCDFEVKIHSIQALRPIGAITPEMLKRIGIESEEKLNELIEQRIKKDFAVASRGQMKKALFDILDETYKFKLPEKLLEQDFSLLWQEVEKNIDKDENLKKKPIEELKVEYKNISNRRVKIGLIIADIISKNNIAVPNDELMKIVEEQANQLPEQKAKIMEFYRNNDNLEKIRGPLLEEKAFDALLSKVKLNDIEMTTEEFSKKTSENVDR